MCSISALLSDIFAPVIDSDSVSFCFNLGYMVKEITEITPKIEREFQNKFASYFFVHLMSETRLPQLLGIEGILCFMKARGLRFNVLPEDADPQARIHALFDPVCILVSALALREDMTMNTDFVKDSVHSISDLSEEAKSFYAKESENIINDIRLRVTYITCFVILTEISLMSEKDLLLFCDYADYINPWIITETVAADFFYRSIVHQYQNSEDGFVVPQSAILELMSYCMGNNASGKLYDPFYGLAQTSRISTLAHGSFYGTENDLDIACLGQLWASMSGVDITNLVRTQKGFKKGSRYDIVASIPPFGERTHVDKTRLSPSSWFLKKAPLHLRQDGIAIGIFSSHILSSELKEYKDIRQNLVETNLLDTIILLPSHLFSGCTSKVAMIVIKNNRKENTPVTFIDATSYCKRAEDSDLNLFLYEPFIADIKKKEVRNIKSVTLEDIREADYLWTPYTYLSRNDSQECANRCFYLKEVAKMEELPVAERKSGPGVAFWDMDADAFNCVIDIDKLENLYQPYGKKYRVLDHSAVLVLLGTTPKFFYCKASTDNPVVVKDNVIALQIDEQQVDPKYFVYSIYRGLEDSDSKTGYRYVGLLEFNNLTIDIPSKEVQLSLYREAERADKLIKAKESGLLEIIEQMKSDYMKEVRSRKHDMKPHIRQISKACSNIQMYLERRSNFNPEELNDLIIQELNAQKKAVQSLDTLLNIFSREATFGEPEVVNIDQFLKDNYQSTDQYTFIHQVDYQSISECLLRASQGMSSSKMTDSPELNVYAAKDDLLRLFNNIVENAVKHGFAGQKKESNYIISRLSVDPQRDMFRIEMTNTGAAFPEGMDKQHYGIRGEKAGRYAGTGEGGYRVRSIVEHYGGDYEISNGQTSGNEFIKSDPSVIVYLPIYRAK